MNLSFYKNIKYSAVGNFLVLVFGIVVVAIISRNLSKEILGYYSIALLITNFIAIFSDLGLEKVIVSDQVKGEQFNSQLKKKIYASSLILFCLSVTLSLITYIVFLNWVLFVMILSLSITPLLIGISKYYLAVLQREKSFKRISIIQISSSLTYLLSVTVLILSGFSWTSLLVASILSQLVAFYLYMLHVNNIRYLSKADSLEIQSYISKGKLQLFERAFQYLYSQIDLILLPMLFGPSVLGVFDYIKKSLNKPITFFNNTLNDPIFSEMGISKNQKKIDLLVLHTNINATVSFIFFGFCFLFSESIVPFYFGKTWKEYTQIFAMLSIALAIFGISRPIGSYWLSIGRYKRSLFWKIATSILISIFYLYCYITSISFGQVVFQLVFLYLFILMLIQYYIIKDLKRKYTEYIYSIFKPLFIVIVSILICVSISSYLSQIASQISFYIILVVLLTFSINKQAVSFFTHLYRSI